MNEGTSKDVTMKKGYQRNEKGYCQEYIDSC